MFPIWGSFCSQPRLLWDETLCKINMQWKPERERGYVYTYRHPQWKINVKRYKVVSSEVEVFAWKCLINWCTIYSKWLFLIIFDIPSRLAWEEFLQQHTFHNYSISLFSAFSTHNWSIFQDEEMVGAELGG